MRRDFVFIVKYEGFIKLYKWRISLKYNTHEIFISEKSDNHEKIDKRKYMNVYFVFWNAENKFSVIEFYNFRNAEIID